MHVLGILRGKYNAQTVPPMKRSQEQAARVVLLLNATCAAQGISDEITDRAKVHVILGHDYMQRVDMRVQPSKQKAWCPPKAAPRIAGSRRAVR
jgi:hypothetical protein